MKKALVLAALVVLAVAFGPGGYRAFQDWNRADEARKRVEWMLRGQVAEYEQLAICQWARGKVVMPMGDIEAVLPDWNAFWREAGFGDGRNWVVSSTRAVDERTAEVTVSRGEERRVLRVRDKEPIALVWDD